jgi:hypothetical protein
MARVPQYISLLCNRSEMEAGYTHPVKSWRGRLAATPSLPPSLIIAGDSAIDLLIVYRSNPINNKHD